MNRASERTSDSSQQAPRRGMRRQPFIERWLRRLAPHSLAGQTIRYGIAGAVVMALYLGLPLALGQLFGLPLQGAIPIAYVSAVSLQFVLQRKFVFRHVSEFALPVRTQLIWYVAVGAVQYPTTALGAFALPKLTGISDRVAFLGTSVVFSVVFFLFIRGRVFHAVVAEERQHVTAP
jgi:putative flippase GtrA